MRKKPYNKNRADQEKRTDVVDSSIFKTPPFTESTSMWISLSTLYHQLLYYSSQEARWQVIHLSHTRIVPGGRHVVTWWTLRCLLLEVCWFRYPSCINHFISYSSQEARWQIINVSHILCMQHVNYQAIKARAGDSLDPPMFDFINDSRSCDS